MIFFIFFIIILISIIIGTCRLSVNPNPNPRPNSPNSPMFHIGGGGGGDNRQVPCHFTNPVNILTKNYQTFSRDQCRSSPNLLEVIYLSDLLKLCLQSFDYLLKRDEM